MKKNGWLLAFTGFLAIFLWKVILKRYIIGPFDLLAGFYDPYQAIHWGSVTLTQAALQYKNVLLSDVITVVLPFKLFSIEFLKNLSLPLWNPYILAGSPNLANVQSAVFYPFNLFYLMLSSQIAYQIYIISQLLLAFVFMFLYLRILRLSKFSAYFGALAFSFSAFFIVWLPWGTVGHAFLWLPLILYSIEKKYPLLFVAGLVLSFFAGHTQTSIMVWGVVIAYLLFRHWSNKKTLLSYVPLLCIAFLLISIQLLPTIEMYRESARDIFRTESFFKDQTLYFSSYFQAIFPDFFGNPVTRNWWGKMNYIESAIYFGSVALYFVFYELLTMIREKRRDISIFFLGLIVFGILLSTQNIFSHLIFLLKIPLISSSTFSRYSMLFIFGGAGMAALGLERYLSDFKKGKDNSINLLNTIAMSLLIIFWILLFTGLLPQEFKNNLAIIKRNSIFSSVLIISTILTYYAVKLISNSTKSKTFERKVDFVLPICFILLLSVELFRFGYKFTPFSPHEFFYPDHALIQELQQLTKNDRYIGYLPANINSIYKIRGAEGAEPLYDKQFGEFASLVKASKVDFHDRAAISFAEGPNRERILDLLSVAYFVDKTDNFRNSWIDLHGKNNKAYDDRFSQIWTDGTFKIYKNKYVLDRQKLFYHTEFIDKDEGVFSRLVDPGFDYQNVVITGQEVDGLIGTGEGSIKIIKDDPSEQQYKITTSKPALFVVTDTLYPGWNVYTDGKKGTIMRANHVFRAVFIGAGNHAVSFKYEPASVFYGSILSIIGLIGLCIYCMKLQSSKT